ncbi:DeoR family transcriptional regulator [bacterium]|nr:DeoR family transcriptional regulator [bacterium]
MKDRNCNSNGIFRYFFTLLFFFIGLIAYIFLKQKGKPKQMMLESGDEKEKIVEKKKKELIKEKGGSAIVLTQRQKVIVESVVKKRRLYPTDLRKLLPDVSTRTIRRDMDRLEELELVKQNGSTKSTYYTYIK